MRADGVLCSGRSTDRTLVTQDPPSLENTGGMLSFCSSHANGAISANMRAMRVTCSLVLPVALQSPAFGAHVIRCAGLGMVVVRWLCGVIVQRGYVVIVDCVGVVTR